jgi:uncharacterized protein YbjT (DUF2867 family)
MEILVIGGTGTVGGEVVRLLQGQDHKVRVLTRSAARAGELPEGVEAAVGDLADPESLRGPLGGADGVFLATPLAPEETRLGLNATEAAKNAGVGRLVYMSVHRVEDGPRIPHFASNLPIERAVRDSGTSWTILRPNNFFQNDLWVRDAIVGHGVYPQPIGGVGLSRVDVRDIADAAVAALTGPGHEGKTYPLVGPGVLTGEATASVYSRLLGRPVRYGGDDLDAWAEQARGLMPGWMVDDLRVMYEHFQRHGLVATEEDLTAVREALGRAPAASSSSPPNWWRRAPEP